MLKLFDLKLSGEQKNCKLPVFFHEMNENRCVWTGTLERLILRGEDANKSRQTVKAARVQCQFQRPMW